MSSDYKPNQVELSIVIPAYHEAKRIESTLNELSIFLKNDAFFKKKLVEVIVVAADSVDNTATIAKNKAHLFKNFTVLKPGKRVGKGRDVRYGMLKASGSLIIFMDADLATPLKYLQIFYQKCQAKGDIIVATRNIRKYRRNIFRYILSNIGNLLFLITGGFWLEDTQCGFKMFSREAAKICFSKQTIMGWSFDMDILAVAHANHLSIESIRVNDWQHKPGGTFEDNLIKNGAQSLVDFLLILYKRIAGKYKYKRR